MDENAFLELFSKSWGYCLPAQKICQILRCGNKVEYRISRELHKGPGELLICQHHYEMFMEKLKETITMGKPLQLKPEKKSNYFDRFIELMMEVAADEELSHGQAFYLMSLNRTVLNSWLDEVDNALPIAESLFNESAFAEQWEEIRKEGRASKTPVVGVKKIYYPGEDP